MSGFEFYLFLCKSASCSTFKAWTSCVQFMSGFEFYVFLCKSAMSYLQGVYSSGLTGKTRSLTVSDLFFFFGS